jgi:putative thioredoxin
MSVTSSGTFIGAGCQYQTPALKTPPWSRIMQDNRAARSTLRMHPQFVMDVTAETFAQDVLEASSEVPVLVDFWAPWCGPCRTLGPMLEKLAAEYGGRFRVAKVNSDEHPGLAREFNVRSIPDVRAFRGGRQVDQFMGALPERQLRAFIEGVVPSPAELERLRAAELRMARDAAGAIAALRKAVELDPAHDLARIDLAELLIDAGEHDEAAQQLAAVRPDVDWDARVEALQQAIGFARAGGSEGDLAERVAADPADLEARLALAGALAARRSWREAMDQLIEIIRRDKAWREGTARKQLLAIFNLAAAEPDLVSEYRRKLSGVLY